MYNKYVDGRPRKIDAYLEGIFIVMTAPTDIELRLVDPERNRARIYGLTECVTLFGEMCLRIVWGRIGNRHLRERSELFESRGALERRRHELLARRRQHGYTEVQTRRVEDVAVTAPAGHAIEREIVESHGLRLCDRTARSLVEAWHSATRALRAYMAEQQHTESLDLEDVSTLASMYTVAAGVA